MQQVFQQVWVCNRIIIKKDRYLARRHEQSRVPCISQTITWLRQTLYLPDILWGFVR